MSQRNCLLWFAVFILALIIVPAASAQTPTADETAIKQLVQQVQDGWNAHDGSFAAPLLSMRLRSGKRHEGQRSRRNRKGSHTNLTTIYKDSRNIATLKGIRFLRDDVAVVHIEWNLNTPRVVRKERLRR